MRHALPFPAPSPHILGFTRRREMRRGEECPGEQAELQIEDAAALRFPESRFEADKSPIPRARIAVDIILNLWN